MAAQTGGKLAVIILGYFLIMEIIMIRRNTVYDAVRMAMPYAKGVSVKARWQPDGTHPL